jgi:ATP/maltotriose-dependent transcriptional regulator MalT
MEDAEAREVVNRDDPQIGGILELAHGWPAVIGLVALNANLEVARETVPDQLYDFFAQELYAALPTTYRTPLGKLSFAVRFDRPFALSVLGSKADRTIEVGIRSGLLTEPTRGSLEIHPLLSDLVQERAFPDFADRRAAATQIGQVLLGMRRWDDAFDLAARFKVMDLLLAAVEQALEELIDLGRIATVTRWLEKASSLHCQSPILDLAEAEVAFRLGDHRKAEALASHAADRLRHSQLSSRAYVRAGHGALLASREEKSIDYFRLAAKSARSPREQREALYGLYSAMSELELPEAVTALEDLRSLEVAETPDDLLRSLAIELIQAVRVGGIQQALTEVEDEAHILEKGTNPLITTSFLHSYSNALSLGAHYDLSLDAAKRLEHLVKQHRLDFARPFAHIDRAVAQIGRRQFARATRDLQSAHRLLPHGGDVHIEGNLAAIRCRLLTATGRAEAALKEAAPSYAEALPSAPLEAEILVSRAAAYACAKKKDRALALLDQAEHASTTSVVVRVLSPAVRSICALDQKSRSSHARAAWRTAQETGNYDSLITAYRGYPQLMHSLAEVGDTKQFAAIVRRARDGDLARHRGIQVQVESARRSPLTPRETEVMDLVAAGLSNKEAAQTLFVSEATVKVHLRHVYEKLRVRGRTEAVARWLAPR